VRDLGEPLGGDVFEGRGGDDGEANKEDIGLGVGEGAQSVVVLLSSGIPKTEVDGLAVDHYIGTVVVKDGGDVFSGEGICGVRNEEASLSDCSITHNDTLDGLHLLEGDDEREDIICLQEKRMDRDEEVKDLLEKPVQEEAE